MHPKNLRIEDFTYELPEERIAKYPLAQRDASKLLVYKDHQIAEDTYAQVHHHLPEGSFLVFNKTKVVYARLLFQKETGGTIEVFCLEPHEQYADIQTAMLQQGKVWWKCMIGGASKWKTGVTLRQKFPELELTAAVVERSAGTFTIEIGWDNPQLSFAEVLHIAGKIPLPPYLRREADESDKDRYQTIYATEEGSVAAPTAGLHFTDGVMQQLKQKGINTGFVTLHVGAGTFKPVKSEVMAEHEMHAEWIDISLEFLKELQSQLAGSIVAVGTTSLRTLESIYWIGRSLARNQLPDFSKIAVGQWDPYETKEGDNISTAEALQALIDWLQSNNQPRLVTRTQIMIAPGYRFRLASGLITNFHQPQSTLLLLVAALIGNDWRKVYDHALSHGFRFLSFGDGSLLWAKA